MSALEAGSGQSNGRVDADSVIHRARDLHIGGQAHEAYLALLRLGPLEKIDSVSGRLVAGRVAGAVGGRRLGEVLHALAWRQDPHDPEVRYYHAMNLLARRGPLRAFEFMEPTKALDASPRVQADWLALRARILADFRDFEDIDRLFDEALRLDRESDWLTSERADVLRRADRIDEARSWLEDAWRRLGPRSRHVLWSLASLRNDVEDREGALEILTEGLEAIESGALLQFKASIEIDQGDLDAAEKSLLRARGLMPLLDRTTRPGLEAQETHIAFLRRDFETLHRLAEADPRGFAASLRPLIEKAPPNPRRSRLLVPRVRQDYATCAPASFCSLTAFWNQPVDHKALSLEISYDGTPGHRERHWAETHGWAVREFRVTWESARQLIDLGLPFTLVTAGAENAHEQVVVGYDELSRGLLILDPSSPLVGSFDVDILTADQEIVGPRGLVIVPSARGAEIESLDLPDAAHYDLRYAIDRALFGNDREAAGRAFEELQRRGPDSIHRLWAQRAIALHDQNEAMFAEFAEQLIRRFRKSASAIDARLQALGWAGRTAESLDLLREVAEGPLANPSFLHTYAQALRPDARESEKVESLVAASLKLRPTHPPSLLLQAELFWEKGRLEAALPLYRFASTGAEASEDNAAAYFRASHRLGRSEEGLRFLRARFERLKAQSSAPFQTLFWQLHEMDRGGDAFLELEAEIERTKEPDFLCWAADMFGRFGRFDRASQLLEASRAGVRASYHDRVAADLHAYQGHSLDAARTWRRIVEQEPLAVDAQRALTSLIATTESPHSAWEYAESVARRFPHHVGLARLRLDWSDVSEAKKEAALRQLLELCPGDPWARRELAWFLGRLGRIDDAREELERAGRLDAASSGFHFVKAEVLALAGEREEARQSFRNAVRADASNVAAVQGLLQLSPETTESLESIRFVISELKRQPRWTDGLFALHPWLVERLPPEDVLKELEALADSRPDHFETALVRIDQLLSMSRPEEALKVIQAAEARFQELPGLALREADAYFQLQRSEDEWAAVEKALRFSPRWPRGVRRYAELLSDAGRTDEGVRRLESAIAQNPFDSALRVQLADTQWRAGRREEALQTIERLVVLDPSSQPAWRRFVEWADTQKCRGRAIAALRALSHTRPGSAELWFLIADTLRRPEDFDERIEALDKAIALNPRGIEAYDVKASLLASAGEFDAAIAACRPPYWEGAPPVELRGRAAMARYQSGAHAAAIKEMFDLVTEIPGYRWGLEALLGWLGETPGHHLYAETAERFTNVAPLEAIAWGHRAAAALAKSRSEEAIGYLRRAVALDPTYVFGVRSLAETLFRAGRHEEAVGALDAAPIGWTSEPVLRLRVRMALELKDDRSALRVLEAWLKLSEVDDDLLRDAIGEFAASGKAGLVTEAFRAAGAAVTSWRAGAAWVAEALSRGKWWVARRRIRTMESSAPARSGGIYQVLVDPAHAAGIGFFRWQHRRDIARVPMLWGAVGNALVRRGHYRAARKSMRDWRGRVHSGEAEPWMLINVLEASLRLGHTEEACDISRAALSLPRDHETDRHETSLAAHIAFDAPPEETFALIRSVQRVSGGKPKSPFRLEIARAVAGFRQSGLAVDERAALPRPANNDPEGQYLYRRARWLLRGPGGWGIAHAIWEILRFSDPVALVSYPLARKWANARYRRRSAVNS